MITVTKTETVKSEASGKTYASLTLSCGHTTACRPLEIATTLSAHARLYHAKEA